MAVAAAGRRTPSNIRRQRDDLQGSIADLDATRARHGSTEQHAESKRELERRLLDEARSPESANIERRPHRWSAAAVALIAPIAAAALYWQVGTPGALSPQAAIEQDANQPSREQINAMIAQIKQRLEKDPDNVEGWTILARTHYALGICRKLRGVRTADTLIPIIRFARDYSMRCDEPCRNLRHADGTRAACLNRPVQWKASHFGLEAFYRKYYKAAADFCSGCRHGPPESPIRQLIQASIAKRAQWQECRRSRKRRRVPPLAVRAKAAASAALSRSAPHSLPR